MSKFKELTTQEIIDIFASEGIVATKRTKPITKEEEDKIDNFLDKMFSVPILTEEDIFNTMDGDYGIEDIEENKNEG